MKTDKNHMGVAVLVVLVLALAAANLYWGTVPIPADEVTAILLGGDSADSGWSFIVWESRVPQCVTALLCGAALAVSGLILQTVFSNPLADSSILGISSGASLGVALVVLAGGGSIAAGQFAFSGFLSVVAGAMAGAMVVMLAVGISLAMAGDVAIFAAVGIIGVCTFTLSAVGVGVGSVFGSRFEQKAQIAGGVILVILGVKILLEHLGVLV